MLENQVGGQKRLSQGRPENWRIVLKLSKPTSFRALARVGAITVAAMACGVGIAQAAPTDPEVQAQLAWRSTISHTPTPHEGCFTATYPSTTWSTTACTTAPNVPYVPRHGMRGWVAGIGAGNGNDYTAVSAGLTSAAEGTFPTVTGVTKETDGKANVYSIQLNSQFFASPTCSGAANPASCLGWEQFVYSSSSQAAFMQYWLITYGNTCPTGWNSYSGDCYRNSAAVSAPKQVIAQLANLRLTGQAVAGGIDTLTFTTATNAYSTTGKDSVVGLAGYWNGSEFNIIGDGGGSEAVFNKGSKVTVNIALTDGSTAAPTCPGNSGTTGETNNLTLGACTVSGGATPSVTFTEKH
jgi:hypothetical protein